MIELSEITRVYRMGKVNVLALNNVSLVINEGEMLAIIGASGSGKSTLMNVLGFLDKPTLGRYTFDGVDTRHFNDDKLAEMRNRSIGFVFQDFNLIRRATALANVELPLIYGGQRDKHRLAMEALEKVGLANRAQHRPTELSGGEQQRVAIARALVNKPKLVLADEPTGNLDTASSYEIMTIMRNLNQEGITVVLVTHEMDIAAQTKRIVQLRDGKIIRDEKIVPASQEKK